MIGQYIQEFKNISVGTYIHMKVYSSYECLLGIPYVSEIALSAEGLSMSKAGKVFATIRLIC